MGKHLKKFLDASKKHRKEQQDRRRRFARNSRQYQSEEKIRLNKLAAA